MQQFRLRSERDYSTACQVSQELEKCSARQLNLLQGAMRLGENIPDLLEDEDHGVSGSTAPRTCEAWSVCCAEAARASSLKLVIPWHT